MKKPYHDLGGPIQGADQAGAVPVELGADYQLWEKRVDAMLRLLSGKAKLMTVDELRRGIETLGEERYSAEPYYGKWTRSIAKLMVERGAMTQDEIDSRVSKIKRERGLD